MWRVVYDCSTIDTCVVWTSLELKVLLHGTTVKRRIFCEGSTGPPLAEEGIPTLSNVTMDSKSSTRDVSFAELNCFSLASC